MSECVCVCVCVCVRACVRACVRVCAQVLVHLHMRYSSGIIILYLPEPVLSSVYP